MEEELELPQNNFSIAYNHICDLFCENLPKSADKIFLALPHTFHVVHHSMLHLQCVFRDNRVSIDSTSWTLFSFLFRNILPTLFYNINKYNYSILF